MGRDFLLRMPVSTQPSALIDPVGVHLVVVDDEAFGLASPSPLRMVEAYPTLPKLVKPLLKQPGYATLLADNE